QSRADMRLVGRLVSTEPHVAVRPENLGVAELRLQLAKQLDHWRIHLTVVAVLVRQPVRLGVVGLQTLVELKSFARPAANRHARECTEVKRRTGARRVSAG